MRTVSRPLPNSSGRRYDSFTSVQQFDEWLERSNAIIMKCLPIAEKYKIAIALENHKDRKVEQHVAFLKKASERIFGLADRSRQQHGLHGGGDRHGDEARPYVKATSLKDMGVAPYDQGFLLSEVLFGTGINDQVKLFALMRKHNPKVNPTTELITRDPLKIPVLTEDYYRSFPEKKAIRDKWMAMVKAKATNLPILSTQSPAARFQAEEDNNRKVFEWGVTHLKGRHEPITRRPRPSRSTGAALPVRKGRQRWPPPSSGLLTGGCSAGAPVGLSMARPASAPAAAPTTVPSVLSPRPATVLPSRPPATPPIARPPLPLS